MTDAALHGSDERRKTPLHNQPNDYLKSAVATASPAALHGMIADAAVRFSNLAAAHLSDGLDRDEAAGYAALDRATACVAEMLSGVNPKAAGTGGEVGEAVAAGVADRFAFCLRRLSDAGRLNDPAPIRDAARVLSVHAETWRELLGGGAATPAAEDATPQTMTAETAAPRAFTPAPRAFTPAPAAAASAAPRSWAA